MGVNIYETFKQIMGRWMHPDVQALHVRAALAQLKTENQAV